MYSSSDTLVVQVDYSQFTHSNKYHKSRARVKEEPYKKCEQHMTDDVPTNNQPWSICCPCTSFHARRALLRQQDVQPCREAETTTAYYIQCTWYTRAACLAELLLMYTVQVHMNALTHSARNLHAISCTTR